MFLKAQAYGECFKMNYLICWRALCERFCHYYFQIRKLKLKEVKFVQNHIASRHNEVPTQAASLKM